MMCVQWNRRVSAVRLAIVLTFLAVLPQARGADDGRRGFVEKVFNDAAGQHRYVVFVPYNYSPSRPSPVILFLHGAGERGTDGRTHLNIGLGPLVKARESNFPAIVVFPQCEDSRGRILQGWLAGTPDAERALKILDQVHRDYRTDPKRQILTGWSMGGFGAWSIAAADPNRWSALVPVAGGGDPETAEKLKNLPIWAWHGDDDHAVLMNRSREMIEAVKAAGGNPRYTEIPGGDHNSWKEAYGDDRLIAWMLDPAKFDPGKYPAPKTPVAPKPVVAEQFITALEIPHALYARLGNQMLEAMAYGAPAHIPQNMLTGRINDIVDYTSAEGYTFTVQFSGITYNGQVNQVRVKAVGKDRLNLQVGLRSAVLNIGTTWVTGESHSATAGPIQIVIGHQRPVWLEADVQPYIQNRQVRLRTLAARFSIPDDNWYVTSPAGVSVSGFGMSQSNVSSGLVGGLYGNKARIEREAVSIVPKLIEIVEKKLTELGEADTFADRFWPLPVYKPRSRMFPQSISTDENGVTLVLGLSVAAIDARKAPKQPQIVDLKAFPPADLSTVNSLKVGLAPGVLEPLTGLLVKEDLARIHVLDIPENTFAKFVDRDALAEAIPELKRYPKAELWSEISLNEGIHVDDITKQDGPTRVQIHAPKVRLSISMMPAQAERVAVGGAVESGSPGTQRGSTEIAGAAANPTSNVPSAADPRRGQPIVVIDFDLKQSGFAQFLKPDSQTRAIRFGWEGDPQIDSNCQFANGYEPEDKTIKSDLIEDWLEESWKAWTALAPVATANVPDIDFGISKLRLSDAGWSAPHLFATFTPPGVKLTNLSNDVFVYETKGPYSAWSNTRYKLDPGKSHDFDISYPLTYRHQNEVYTLAPGSHSEFRVPIKGGPPRLFQARENP